ncbi:hypothetical protein AB1Y20_004132 [Prymnesium parvum]|uniref:Proteasome subunit beta n=1 Tax=Prymnesium parvum TaxID=97485 RepID=A0AB34J702_PRYPA
MSGQDALIAFVGEGYAMVCADQNAGRSIMVFQKEEDKIMQLDSHKLLALGGDPADTVQEPEYFQKNMNLYALKFGVKLTTHAAANYMRGHKSENLRKGMTVVDMLLCGYDDDAGPSLYFIDYLASMQKLDKGAHGYAGFFVNSLLDAHWKPKMTEQEGLNLMDLCIAEIQRRFMISMPNYLIKIVDKNGTRILRSGPVA